MAMYANEPVVTQVIPCMWALPDRVALMSSWSTELGDVKTCLYACRFINECQEVNNEST